MIDNYIRALIKKLKQRDREYFFKLNPDIQLPFSIPPSDEVYLLQKYRWLILANHSNIKYHSAPRVDSHFHVLMNTFDYEYALFRIDPKLREYRELKEKYVQFNSHNAGNPTEARKEMQTIIQEYRNSQHDISVSLHHYWRNLRILSSTHSSWLKRSVMEGYMTAVCPTAP